MSKSKKISRVVGARGSGGEPWPFQILADPLTLPGTDYAHHITTCPPPGFSDLPTTLISISDCTNIEREVFIASKD